MRRNYLILGLCAVAFVLACVIPGAATPVPAIDPGEVHTIIVQTANAASTRTALARPTNTPTVTRTPTPRETASPAPTATNPFVFVLPGTTSSLSAPTLASITNGTVNSNYGCSIFSTEPANNTVFAPRTDFIATWGVKNIGKKDWFRATMDYVYISGDKLHKVTSYDLPKGVERGKNAFLPVDMVTFKNPGTYTTTWALVADNNYFCKMTLTVIVQ